MLHKTGLSQEHAKIVLPAVAYFCNTGPWRMAWIKFGYNPQKDSNSRIYQTLDYRIRTAGNYTILFFFLFHVYICIIRGYKVKSKCQKELCKQDTLLLLYSG